MGIPLLFESARKAAWHLRHGGIAGLQRYRLHQNSDVTRSIFLSDCHKLIARRRVLVEPSPLRPRIKNAFLQRRGIAVFTKPETRERDVRRAKGYALVLGINEPIDIYVRGAGNTYTNDDCQYLTDSLPFILHGYEAVVIGDDNMVLRENATICGTPVLNDEINLEHWRANLDLLGYMQRIDQCVVRANGTISVVIATNRPHQLTHVLATLTEQNRQADEVFIGTHGFSADAATRASARELDLPVTWKKFDSTCAIGGIFRELISLCSGSWIAKMDDDDLYGREYLADAAWLAENTDADAVGKNSYYVYMQSTDETRLRFPGRELIETHLIAGPTILMRSGVAEEVGYPDVERSDDTTFVERINESGGKIVAGSRFGFSYMRHTGTHNWTEAEEVINNSSVAVHIGAPDNYELPYGYGGEVVL